MVIYSARMNRCRRTGAKHPVRTKCVKGFHRECEARIGDKTKWNVLDNTDRPCSTARVSAIFSNHNLNAAKLACVAHTRLHPVNCIFPKGPLPLYEPAP